MNLWVKCSDWRGSEVFCFPCCRFFYRKKTDGFFSEAFAWQDPYRYVVNSGALGQEQPT